VDNSANAYAKLTFPKPKRGKRAKTREMDPKYIQWVHGWDCCVPNCSTPWPVQAHHETSKGAGGSDRTSVPLCHNHHVGLDGIHNIGALHFQKKFNVRLETVVERMNAAYENKVDGPHQDKIEKAILVYERTERK
jgi:hypothetical protein